MGEQSKVRVWLKEIEYTGGNVGSDTEFAITVNGQTVQIGTDIKAGTRRVFDQPLLEEPAADAEVKAAIAITVLEEDVLVDDVGQSQVEYVITKGQRRQALPPLTVSVQENLGVLGTGETARFIFHFEVELLAAGTVKACCWNGDSVQTKTLAAYYAQSSRHRRMADYLAGACVACESMKQSTSAKAVCVIALGLEAKRDVEVVFSEATAYPTFASWQAGTADGFIVAASGADYLANYRHALQECIAAYKAGY